LVGGIYNPPIRPSGYIGLIKSTKGADRSAGYVIPPSEFLGFVIPNKEIRFIIGYATGLKIQRIQELGSHNLFRSIGIPVTSAKLSAFKKAYPNFGSQFK
jgi:hypothetical protein